MPYSSILIHLVWATKKRKPFINDKIRSELLKHIRDNAKAKGIYIRLINAHVDHVHCLLSLGNDQKLSDVVRNIKGESSYWVNKQNLVAGKFAWQQEFYAMSVGLSNLPKLVSYINNQKKHHEKTTFQQEYDDFIEKLSTS